MWVVRVERVDHDGRRLEIADIWCQIKADQTGYDFAVPRQTEAASLGCALIEAVASGVYDGYQQGHRRQRRLKKDIYTRREHTSPYQAPEPLDDTLIQASIGPRSLHSMPPEDKSKTALPRLFVLL